MRFKLDWASLVVGSKFTVFTLFYFVFEGNFPSTSPRGAYIWRGDLTEGFFALPVWGAYIWRGLYMKGLIFGILRYALSACACVFVFTESWSRDQVMQRELHAEIACVCSRKIILKIYPFQLTKSEAQTRLG